MNELKIIKEQNVLGKDFKVYGDFENPVFVAKDVAEWIGHSNSSELTNILNDDEKGIRKVDTLGGLQSKLVITENGLYRILMKSNKPLAQKFQTEVFKILKDIRKNGIHVTDKLLDDPDTLLEIVTKYRDERIKTLALEQELTQAQPMIDFANAVHFSKSGINIGIFAKEIDIKPNTLFEILRRLGILYKKNGGNVAKQCYIDRGYFEQKKSTKYGHNFSTPILTAKGQEWLYKKLKENEKDENIK